MKMIKARHVTWGVALVSVSGLAPTLQAQIGIGTWVKKSEGSAPGALTMTVEACCNGGRKLTYQIGGGAVVMTVTSPFDGSDAPILVNGQPSGQTMGIKRVDDRHTFAVLKINGKTFGTSKGTLSADGNTLTVENDVTSTVGGQVVGKQIEVWVRKGV